MKQITLLFLLTVFFVVGCGSSADEHNHGEHDMSDGEMENMEMDSDLDTSTSKMSDDGMFHVTVTTDADPVPINELHTWTLTLMDADMQPVDDATVTFGGGMPAHNHGFPTEPQVTTTGSNGDYLIEGVKMQMSGHWEMIFDIESGDMADTITFNIVLP